MSCVCSHHHVLVCVSYLDWGLRCSDILCGAHPGAEAQECLQPLLLDAATLRLHYCLDQCLLHPHKGESLHQPDVLHMVMLSLFLRQLLHASVCLPMLLSGQVPLTSFAAIYQNDTLMQNLHKGLNTKNGLVEIT